MQPDTSIHTTTSGQEIKRDVDGWLIRLTDPAEIALFGTDWIPLPLTGHATLETVIAHVDALKANTARTAYTVNFKTMTRKALLTEQARLVSAQKTAWIAKDSHTYNRYTVILTKLENELLMRELSDKTEEV